jgi:DNA polymerase III subunit beta
LRESHGTEAQPLAWARCALPRRVKPWADTDPSASDLAPMKLVCSQAELSSSLQLVSRAVAARPTHPVLANVLLTADAATGRLSLTGFDLSLGIQTSLPAAVETSGAITLPARLFGEIVSRLSADSPLTLSCAEGEEQVDLTSLSGTYRMRGMPAEDFPDLPLAQSGTPIRLDAESLVKGLRATLFASSGDEAKQLLTGVHLRLVDHSLECAATDGHRLAVLRLEDAIPAGAEVPLGEGGEPFAVTVPARSLRELERLLSGRPSDEPLSLFSERGQVVVLWGDQVLTSRNLDGTYPNYRQLLPESFGRRLSLDRRAFTAALERVAVLADQHNNVVKISSEPLAGQVQIRADAQDVGSGSEAVAATIEGEAIEIAFNVRYLLDGLKAIGAEQVVLQCNGPTTPAVLAPVGEDGHFTYLVMPVQIRS